MSTIHKGKPWDFSHVLDLVSALSSPPQPDRNEANDYVTSRDTSTPTQTANAVSTEAKDFAKPAANLGDFGKIWQFLGTRPHPPTNVTSSTPQHAFNSKDDYTSDGAIRYGLRSKEKKKVTWKEETSADEPGTDSASELSATHTPMKLTKSQRKKQNRKARKAHELATGLGTVSESEADGTWSITPARKASTHAITTQQPHRHNMRQRSTPALNINDQSSGNIGNGHNGHHVKDRQGSHSQAPTNAPQTPPKLLATNMRSSSQPITSNGQDLTHNIRNEAQWPVSSNHSTKNSTRFLPSTIPPQKPIPQKLSDKQTPLANAANQAVAAVQAAQAQLLASPTTKGLPARLPTIEPKIVRSGEDRHMALLLKLLNDFAQDRKYLVSPMNLTTHNNDPNGIHLFVDASNIFIGFNDQLKRSRGIPLRTRVPPVNLSFDALALLMERRRPVAKRILLGSTPWLPAFDKAQAVGYECSILEKVYKKRELTERQIYFRDTNHRHSARAKAASDLHESADSSMTTPPRPSHNAWQSTKEDWNSGASGSESRSGLQFDREKWIEQGVDEILHLKIAQSVLDCDTPATMVIATGDAAQAEYSDGFGAMVRRALDRGWQVEIVSWSKNISSLYLGQAFRERWQGQFRVVFLDDYAEELLDM